MDYLLHILILIAIYTTLASSLDLLAGHLGILSVAHSAFYGLGAYTSAILTVRLGASCVLGVAVGMGVAAIVSVVVSLPSLRVHDDYFVIATFGFQVILFSILNGWMSVTNGPLGIAGIPQPKLLGHTISSPLAFFSLAVAFAIFAYLVVWRMTESPLGRVLHAIREDSVFVESLGKNVLHFKVVAFAVSAALAASAGSLYAQYTTYIDPTSFTVLDSILIISMVIIGGAGSHWGPPIGVALLVTLPEVLRFVGLPSAIAANLRQILYGTLLVIIMMFRSRGLVGRYTFNGES